MIVKISWAIPSSTHSVLSKACDMTIKQRSNIFVAIINIGKCPRHDMETVFLGFVFIRRRHRK